MFYLFLDISCNCVYLDIVYVSHICCKCFIWMLHMLAMALKCFQVFQTYVARVSSIFRCMLQVFHLDVTKVDQVLHMLQCA